MIEDGNATKVQDNKLNENFYKKEFQTLWSYINHKYTYTVEFNSDELIKKAIAHIDEKMFVAQPHTCLQKECREALVSR